MYLYLVRHGESVGNAEKLFFGQWDCPLTCKGWQHAWQTADKLRNVMFHQCYASDLRRAWETAEVCLTGRQVSMRKCPELREQFLGELERRTWEEACQHYGTPIQAYLDDWFHSVLPQAESPREMMTRVSRCVEEIIAGGEDTLVVAHNGTLNLLLYYLGLVSETDLNGGTYGFRFGCYSTVRIDAAGATLESFNI